MRFLLLAAFVLLVVGCDTGAKHNFFKPEVSGAVYAVPHASGDPSADESASLRDEAKGLIKLPRPNWCYYGGPGVGWMCPNDYFGEELVDDDRYLAAPTFKLVSALDRMP